MADRALCVIPQPKQVTRREGAFSLNAQTSILLLPTSGEEDHSAARSLRQEILEATGLRLPIVKTARPARMDNIVLLVSDYQATEAFLDKRVRWDEDLGEHGLEAHFVDVAPQRVIAGGETRWLSISLCRHCVRSLESNTMNGPRCTSPTGLLSPTGV